MNIQNSPELFNGFGSSTQDEINKLMKALEVGGAVHNTTQLSGGQALIPQNLQPVLKKLTFKMDDIKLYKDLMKDKAFSTKVEYNVQKGFGQGGGFVGEVQMPEGGQGIYKRQVEEIKYLREKYEISDVLLSTQTTTPVLQLEQNNAMMRLLRNLEEALFTSDSSLLAQSFNGILPTIRSKAPNNIIDMRGATLTQDRWKQAAEIVAANFGNIDKSKAYMSQGVLTTQNAILDASGSQRLVQNMGSIESLMLGHSAKGIVTPYGNINFEYDLFLNNESKGVPTRYNPNLDIVEEGATSAKAPVTPNLALTPIAATVTGSKWLGTGYAPSGAYQYRVAAANQYGKSAACAAVTATVATGGAMRLTIQNGGGMEPVQYYEIYRETSPGSGKMRYLTSIAYTGSTQTWDDLNVYMSGTSRVYLFDVNQTEEFKTIDLRELMPIFSQPLDKIGPFVWGIINYYVTPIIYAPQKFVIFENVGVADTTTVSPLLDV